MSPRSLPLALATLLAVPAAASAATSPSPDLALTASGPAFAVVDVPTAYDFTIANRGTGSAAGVALSDPIPTGTRLVRTEGDGTCTGGATLRCALGSIPAGASRTVTVVLSGTAAGTSFHHVATIDTPPPSRSASIDTYVTEPSTAPPQSILPMTPCANALRGGRDDDVLVGTGFGDRITGLEGRDLLRGGEGPDCLWGGTGDDVVDGDGGDDQLWGGDGRDRLEGGVGDDRLIGGRKADQLSGGPGNDQLLPSSGRDRVFAGLGDDVIAARDGARDVIFCGPGNDRVVADRIDVLRGCEQRSRR
jgi:uncharacterized repeat protein (TIGR01451 family)